MNETDLLLGTVEDNARDLLQLCRKGGPLYSRHRTAAAQVSRTAKWLLNAIARLRDEMERGDGESQ